jgi:hypothetical protein
MIRVLSALAMGCAMCVAGMAASCDTSTWTFDILASCGSGSNGVTFTQGGETITIFPELVMDQNTIVGSGPLNPVNGLFEVQQGAQGNLASGIGPYVNMEGGSPYTGQQGIQDKMFGDTRYDAMLFIEVSQTGPNAIPSGTTLSFLMQEGDVADTFTYYTETVPSGTNTPPNLSSMTKQDASPISVGTKNGGATTSQFQVVTSTTSGDPIEFIGIQADCTYLLLNSITSSVPSSVPEPRFYGLLLAGLLCGAGVVYQKRRAARANA